jgi:hypothetical protein
VNYVITGSLVSAAREVGRAVNTIGYPDDGSAEHKFKVKLIRLLDSIERTEKQARKLIPGGWKPPQQVPEVDR